MTPTIRTISKMHPELFLRAAAVAPSTLNVEARTVEVIFSTGARVLRGGLFTDPYVEELSLDPKHVRLQRLQSGNAPVLNAHSGWDLDDVLGVVEHARLEKSQGIARLRFARDDPKADAAWRKVEQGVLRNISVGYRVHAFEETTPAADGRLPVRKAVDWEPYEVSLVPMGADPGAVVRSEERTMNPETIETEPKTTPDAAAAERERAATILRQCRAGGVPELAEGFIADGLTTEQVAVRVLDRMRERGADALGPRPGPSGVGYGAGVREAGLEGQEFRSAAVDALLVRSGIPVASPHPATRDLPGSVHELARLVCSRHGLRTTGLSAERLIERVMTTSDFPLLLADAVGKSLRAGYETEPASHRAWVRPVPVANFKDQLRPILGSAPSLALVIEGGEYTEGPMDEDSTSYRVAKYGRIVALTWETLVNDDLGAFLRVQPAMGQAARRLEADTVYALFALNSGAGPTMQDALALFHTTHANLGSSAAFDATSLGAARALLRKQTAVGGGYLSLVPRFLIVPAEREQQAELLLAAATRTITTAATDVVPGWIGDLRLVVEPRLPNGAVYLAADASQIDTLELGLLTENVDGPALFEEREFITDVLRWKVRHVFGAKFLDWRGIIKQPIT